MRIHLFLLHLRLASRLAFVALLLFFVVCCSAPQQQENKKENFASPGQQPESRQEEKAGSTESAIVSEEPDPPALPEQSDTAETPVPLAVRPKEDKSEKTKPRIAIIIDDMGYHEQIGLQLLGLDLNLTFAFLPGAPHTVEQADLAFARKRDILVHLPMQPKSEQWDPGPGALLLKYSREELYRQTEKLLAKVPHSVGANNHMGSEFTENRNAMHSVLLALQKQSLFFIDSFTTAHSTGLSEARKMGIPAARRHVFLDNAHDMAKVRRQIQELVTRAHSKGHAIGIGHPHTATLAALTECSRTLLASVEIVGVHALVR
ncbi:MAG: hypothetical protein CSA31_00685 [Desulfobulbus propionicus]|nr:MAG: hypothetical protein CSA31_00685 [Desulfobulbus propionicus]